MAVDSGPVGAHRLGVASLGIQREAEARMGVGVVGFPLDDGTRGRLEVVKSSKGFERVPQVEMRVGLVEVEPDSFAAGLYRFGIPSLRQQDAPYRGASFAGFRIDSDRGAIGGLGLGVAMLLGENLAEIAVRPRVVGPEADGLAE